MTTHISHPATSARIALTLEVTLVPPSPGSTMLACSVGPDNRAIVLWTDPSSENYWLVSRQGERVLGTVRIPARPWSADAVQPMPDGGVLVAARRCDRVDGVHALNAAVYNAAGELTHEGSLGDGIEEILTTSRGDVWVGYFDEGIFSQAARSFEDSRSLGGSGLVRFTSDLKVDWEFDFESSTFADERTAHHHRIAHVYSLNVTDANVHAYTYMSFSIARIVNDVVHIFGK